MTQKTKTIGIRLAVREEGSMLNAYLALDDTMEGARLISSMVIGPLQKDRELFERWKSILTDIMAAAIKEMPNVSEVTWKEQAPREPRGGNA